MAPHLPSETGSMFLLHPESWSDATLSREGGADTEKGAGVSPQLLSCWLVRQFKNSKVSPESMAMLSGRSLILADLGS